MRGFQFFVFDFSASCDVQTLEIQTYRMLSDNFTWNQLKTLLLFGRTQIAVAFVNHQTTKL